MGTTLAQSEYPIEQTTETSILCEDTFTLNGPETVYLGETLNYSISPTVDPNLVFPVFYTLTVNSEEKSQETSKNSPLQLSFDTEGTQTITATITKGECTYTLEKTLHIYQNALVYF
ncbi:MAG: hypothetical protein LBP53_09050 [Candidatus Peribacteria bacterium]|nr:hypothetical protein [Candidatus Peribacteria bacterium]